ncbi:hypothetical protein LIER_05986 [Lithospermum erythrorhizon]|uniref:DCD domain-containing protein n=1 Tax=Lithospermum erythrorhizon TaxID=34254 RepID=A0AAV3P363_LITER
MHNNQRMVVGRRTQSLKLDDNQPSQKRVPVRYRNLGKSQLGGVVFGTTNNTIKECLAKQIFGLPAQHLFYVKNINPGLPLFLFNYSDRKMHGIFEAASPGQMNINPYAFTLDGSEKTHYPAQVQIRVRLQCQPLVEDQFKLIIFDNYYSQTHFWFELDHVQANKLISKLSASAISASSYQPRNTENCTNVFHGLTTGGKEEESEADDSPILTEDFTNSDGSLEKLDAPDVSLHFNGQDKMPEAYVDCKQEKSNEMDFIYKKLRLLALDREHASSSMMQSAVTTDPSDKLDSIHEACDKAQEITEVKNEKDDKGSSESSCQPTFLSQLLQEVQELKVLTAEHTQKIYSLEQKLADKEQEIKQLRNRCMMLESVSNPSLQLPDESATSAHELDLDLSESIFLVGGYDGTLWLPALDLYSPLHDVIKSLKPMNSARAYASAAKLNGQLYIFGGGDGSSWFDTVEVYNPAQDQWTPCPPLNGKKGSLATVTWNDKIFSIGGGDGMECFSAVEMYDINVGRWIPTRSMLQKRFSLAATELNGMIYAVGGFDGNNYLSSAERFDPRDHSWTKIESMSTARGCHSLVVLDEKLYVFGGYDGTTMASNMEIYDPRLCKWMPGDPMNQPRGFSAAAVLKDSIYVIGGVESLSEMVDSVECYKEGEGWKSTSLKAVGRRCFSSAVVLGVD